MRWLALVLSLCGIEAFAQNERFELPAEQRTGTIRRILVLPHSHLDIGFTLPPDQVARDYKDSIDVAIRLARENADFRWTIESTWMLGEWLRRTSDEAALAELGRLLRERRFGLGATFASMHSGLMDAEETNRLVYAGESFRRRFGIKAEVAYQNDVPGFSWAYPRVLAGSGVKYLVTGLNLFIGGGNSLGVRNTPFYWVGPDGSKVLTWFTYDSYVEGYRWKLSSAAPIEDLERTLPRRLAWLERNGYPYDTYLLMDAVSDNGDPSRAYQTLLRIREWNRRHPELPMQPCIAEEFFEYLVGKYGDRFKEVPGDAAGHWELVKLGAPEVSSRMREAAALLPAAESLAAIASLLNGSPYPRYDFAEAWRELLTYHEHTAGAGPGWPGYFTRWQTDWNNTAHYAAAMSGYSNTRQLFDKAVARLAGSAGLFDPAHKQTGTEATVLVYNGLSWPRSGPVTIEGLPAALRQGAIEVVDLRTQAILPVQDVPGTQRHVLFHATDIPAIGYRLYLLRKATTSPVALSQQVPVEVKWNALGQITSIRDTGRGVEMIDRKAQRPFGALLVSRNNAEYLPIAESPANVNVIDGPLARQIEISREQSALRWTTVTLYRENSYADLAFTVKPTGDDQGCRYAIAMPVKGLQELSIDGAGMILRIPQDLLPGGGPPQYAPLHFIHFGESSSDGITVANRDAFLFRPDGFFLVMSENLATKTRDEGAQRLFRTEPRGNEYLSFRFRLAVQGDDPVVWKKFGAEWNLPLQASIVPRGSLAEERSLLSISHANVKVTAFKPSEFEAGWYILRLQEIGGKSAENVRVITPFRVIEAAFTNLVESRSGAAADLSRIPLRPWQTVTILVRLIR